MKLEHVAMYVNDLERAKNFFVKYFNATANDGYHNPQKKFRSYFLTFAGEARLEIMSKADMVDAEKFPTRTGFIHIAFSIDGKDNVDALTEKLRTDGFTVMNEPRTTGDGYYESCIVDPEGNEVEIVTVGNDGK